MRLKGILGMLLAGAVAVGTAVSVFAEGIYVSNTDDKGFIITSDVDINVNTVVADYDINGRFVSAFTKLVDAVKGDNTYTYDELGVSGISSERKVMLWKGEENSIEPVDGTKAAAIEQVDEESYAAMVIDMLGTDEDSDVINTIYFASSTVDFSELIIEEGKKYNFVLDGQALTVDELKTGDVLTVKFEDEYSFADLDEYNITVSRNKVSGMVVSLEENEDGYYTCTLESGNEYICTRYAGNYYVEMECDNLLYLDAFGRICYAEEIVDYGEVGIIEDIFFNEADGTYSADIITPENEIVNYQVSEGTYNELAEVLFRTGNSGRKMNITQRVISYYTKEDGSLVFNQKLDSGTALVGVYHPSTAGSYMSMQLENTKYLMEKSVVGDEDRVEAVLSSYLVKGQKYKVYFYGPNPGYTYEFAFVEVIEKISLDNYMAVLSATVAESEWDGETVYEVRMYADGEEKVLQCKNKEMIEALNTGDAFFYNTDADGFISEIVPVFASGVTDNYLDFYNGALENKLDIIDESILTRFPADTSLAFGILTEYFDSSSDELSLITKDTLKDVTKVDLESDVDWYDVSDAVIVYEYDYEITHKNDRVQKASTSSLKAVTWPKKAFVDDSEEILDLTSSYLSDENSPNYGRARFVLLRLVDDEIVEAYVIRPSNIKG